MVIKKLSSEGKELEAHQLLVQENNRETLLSYKILG